ncbi:MAG: hypothetical protein IPJ40_05660 [Saprospirales bacterium]|nr:hypothetical protein [Saprospirales bacterium]
MRNSFISLVTVIQYPDEFRLLSNYLTRVHASLSANFSDLEIVLVNNTTIRDINRWIGDLDPLIKQHIYLLNLSSLSTATTPSSQVWTGQTEIIP